MPLNKQALFTLILTLFFTNVAFSQIQQENSPYSFFGLGDLKSNNIGLNRSMADIANAYSSPLHINTKNPASLGDLKFATLHTGVFGNAHWLTNSQSSTNEAYNNNSFNASMEYLTVGVPISKIWGMSVSLKPFARTSYDILRVTENPNIIQLDSTLTENTRFLGTGEFYKVQWSNGISTPQKKEGIFKSNQFSFGLNANYYFGNRSNSTLIYHPNIPGSLGFNESEALQLSGWDWVFNTGILYKKRFFKDVVINNKKTREEVDKILTLGLTLETKSNLNATRDFLIESVLLSNTNDVVPGNSDTIGNFTLNDEGTVTLPTSYGFGIHYNDIGNFQLEVDVDYYNWSEYQSFGTTDSNLKDAFRVALGGSVDPKTNLSNTRGMLSRLNYRFGAYYYSNHIQLETETYPDIGLTFGFGLPVNNNLKFKRFANMNLAFNLGQRGSILNNNIKETYFKTTFGFSFNDGNWFIKRKYD